MNIRQLETFYWIAQLGTFSAAAERLHTSQANVSARIRELEEELDIALFERIGRRVQLTMKARELLPHAYSVVTDAARLRMAAGRPELLHSVIKIGMGEAVAAQSLVAIIDELKQHYPDAEVGLEIDLNVQLINKVSRGDIDVAVVAGPVDAPELQFTPIGAMDLAWVGLASRFRNKTLVRPADLANVPLMVLPREARLHTQMLEWFAEHGTTPTRVSYCNNLTTMLDAARAGICVSLMPKRFFAADLRSGKLLAPVAQPSLGALKFYVATRVGGIDPAVTEIAAIVAKAALLHGAKPADSASPTVAGEVAANNITGPRAKRARPSARWASKQVQRSSS